SEGGADIGVLDLSFNGNFLGIIDDDEDSMGGTANTTIGRIGNGTIAIESGNVVTLIGYENDVWVLNGTVNVNQLNVVDGDGDGGVPGGIVLGGDVTTMDSIEFDAAILLIADVVITSTNGDIIFNGTIDSARDLAGENDGFKLTVNTPATAGALLLL